MIRNRIIGRVDNHVGFYSGPSSSGALDGKAKEKVDVTKPNIVDVKRYARLAHAAAAVPPANSSSPISAARATICANASAAAAAVAAAVTAIEAEMESALDASAASANVVALATTVAAVAASKAAVAATVFASAAANAANSIPSI